MRRPFVIATLVAGLTVPAGAEAAQTPELPAFETCQDLVGFARQGVSQPQVPVRADVGFSPLVQPRAPRAQPPARTPSVPGTVVSPAAASPETSFDSATSGGVEEAFSTTNVQESGIDEPDVAKSDGKRLFVVVGSELWALDVSGDAPTLISRLGLEAMGGELLLRGDRLLVIGSVSAGDGTSQTRLAEVDVRNPAAMTIARTMHVPGQRVSARMTGGTIRVVLTTPAAVPTTGQPTSPGSGGPVPIDGRATPAQAPSPPPPAPTTTTTRAPASARSLGLRAFMPRTVLRSRRTNRTFRRNLVPCDRVRHPEEFAGLDLLTVLTVDFDEGLFNVDRDAVMASAQVVYASEAALYVASTEAAGVDEASDVPRGVRTEIHRFDASEPGETTYTSSGSVPGFALNQYAFSELNGDLRVATTDLPLWLPGAPAQESASSVTVLRQSGDALKPVGRVGGLGKGERIFAARFIGDVGYLVTFRQTDPLYTLDLRDPTAPRVVGELKINGYSAYLHPIGDDLLLGIGQDATDQGRVLGAQASVFDVSDPAAPTRLSQLALGATGSSTPFDLGQFDPHAFLWWGPAKMAFLPVSGYDPQTYASLNSATAVRAGRAEGLAKVGEITHGPAWDQAEIRRSFIVGDRVFTLSDLGVAANRMPGLQPLGFAPFKP